MSKRSEIMEGAYSLNSRTGLVYTCKCGWIDLGHARPDNAEKLWKSISNEKSAVASRDGKGFKVRFGEMMSAGKGDFYARAGIEKSYYIKYGLSKNENESVALAIFMEVSLRFENFQMMFPNFITDSGFSAEDLVSNILGFYRAVRPGPDYLLMCQPVSKKAALEVWDKYGSVGSNKNRMFAPYLYPCKECSSLRDPQGPSCAPIPNMLNTIQPVSKGNFFRDWDREIDEAPSKIISISKDPLP
jgi:hypothetical protein